MKYLLIFGILFNLIGCNVITPEVNGVSTKNPSIIGDRTTIIYTNSNSSEHSFPRQPSITDPTRIKSKGDSAPNSSKVVLMPIREVLIGSKIQKRCDLPPNYVLTGIGMDTPEGRASNLITAVKLEGRKINTNGTLDTRKMFCDTSTRKFLSVPDGGDYIITGIGAAVSNNKKRPRWWKSHEIYTWPSALRIWYREFDPVNRKLKGGEPYSRSSGGNSLSLRYLPEEHGFDVENTVVTSVGMGVSNYSLTGLLVKVSTLE